MMPQHNFFEDQTTDALASAYQVTAEQQIFQVHGLGGAKLHLLASIGGTNFSLIETIEADEVTNLATVAGLYLNVELEGVQPTTNCSVRLIE